jgi:hypothetical protein
MGFPALFILAHENCVGYSPPMKVQFHFTLDQMVPFIMAQPNRSFSDGMKVMLEEPLAWLKENAPGFKVNLSEKRIREQVMANHGLTLVFDIPQETQAIYFKMAWPEFTSEPVRPPRQKRPKASRPPPPRPPFILEVAYPSRMLDASGAFKPPVLDWIKKRKAAIVVETVHEGYSRVRVDSTQRHLDDLQRHFL